MVNGGTGDSVFSAGFDSPLLEARTSWRGGKVVYWGEVTLKAEWAKKKILHKIHKIYSSQTAYIGIVIIFVNFIL